MPSLFPFSKVAVAAIVSAIAINAPTASAKFAQPQNVPIDRLVANQTAFLKKNPNDWKATYTLARIHYLAFANDVSVLGAYQWKEEDPYTLARWQNFQWASVNAEAEKLTRAELKLDSNPQWKDPKFKEFNKVKQTKLNELRKNNWKPTPKTPNQTMSHYNHSKDLFQKVIENDKDPALATLGLASLEEQYASAALQERLRSVQSRPKASSINAIADSYHKAFSLAQKKDAERKFKPLHGLNSLVSYEAGKAYLRLAPEGEHVAAVKAHIAKMGPITPLVIDLTGKRKSINDLIDSSKSVQFDLAGIGKTDTYSWPHADAGFLVWAPNKNLKNTKITNGKQLFGVYTWGIFWQDGFQALASLDNDHNGELAGTELESLAIWQDANQNGISEAGEVKPLETFQIKSLSTSFNTTEGIHPHHADGVRLNNGKSLPVWDWMAEPK